MEKDFGKMRVINFVNQDSLDDLRQLLHQHGFRMIDLDGQNITDADSFFAATAEQLPQDPELVGQKANWDALLDSLWGGLVLLEENRVALLWLHADRMLHQGLPDLLIATEVLRDLARQVSTTEHGGSHPILLQIFLVGGGENFKPL
jgi:hypothetical protein